MFVSSLFYPLTFIECKKNAKIVYKISPKSLTSEKKWIFAAYNPQICKMYANSNPILKAKVS